MCVSLILIGPSTALEAGCRVVSRVSHGHHVATGYRAKAVTSHFGYGHGYHAKAAFIAVEPYYVDVVATDIRQKNALQRQTDLHEKLLRQEGELNALKGIVAGLASGSTNTSAPLALQAQSTAEIDIVRTHCAKCHSGDGSSGGFQLFQPDKQTPTDWGPMERYLIVSAITSNAMPPAGNEAVPDEDFEALQKWLTADDRKAVRATLLKGD